MSTKTFTITTLFGQKESRTADVIESVEELPVGFGKIGTIDGYVIYADRSVKYLEYVTQFFAIKK